MLVVNNLTIKHNQKTLIKNINLNFERGKLYGLIGHNGSGKSTLIKALAGENTPTQGQILIDNKPLASLSARKLARQLAYLPQKLPDATYFTVSELVMLGRYPHQRWLQSASMTDKKIVADAIEQTGVRQFYHQTVATLSGGERARAWLAMCLAQQTDYLLLDEPLAALDIVYQLDVLKLIRKLVDEQGLGVIIILHDINLTAQFCDEVVAMKQGEVCHQGDIATTMQTSVLHDIFGIDLHLLAHPTTGQTVAVV